MTILYLAIAAGAAFGLATSRASRPFTLPAIRCPALLAIALALQIPFIYAAPISPEEGLDPLRLTLPTGLLLTLVFLVANRHLAGMRFALLGVAANAAVVLANGGLMPTNAEVLATAGLESRLVDSADPYGTRLVRSKDVLLRPQETRLAWLSDVLVSPPAPYRTVMSVGDLFLAAGLATLAATTLRRSAEQRAIEFPTGPLARVQAVPVVEADRHPTDGPSPEMCRLLNAALFVPKLRVELLTNPLGAATRLAAATPQSDILDDVWPPSPHARPGRLELTPHDWAALRQLRPAATLADLWQSIDGATAEVGVDAPAERRVTALTPAAPPDVLDVATSRRAA